MSEINSNKQRILITGVSGLIGRILFNHFTKTYPEKYEVFGLDQNMNISARYQAGSNKTNEIETIYPLPLDKFIECDVTDRDRLFQIIEQQRIQTIIHLAALLESHPNLENISRVNIEGAKNVFEAREFFLHSFVYIA